MRRKSTGHGRLLVQWVVEERLPQQNGWLKVGLPNAKVCFIFAIISLNIAPLALVLEFVLVAVRPRNLEE
jgi:uncharacterized membrane protein